jgi:hypothetical protein
MRPGSPRAHSSALLYHRPDRTLAGSFRVRQRTTLPPQVSQVWPRSTYPDPPSPNAQDPRRPGWRGLRRLVAGDRPSPHARAHVRASRPCALAEANRVPSAARRAAGSPKPGFARLSANPLATRRKAGGVPSGAKSVFRTTQSGIGRHRWEEIPGWRPGSHVPDRKRP